MKLQELNKRSYFVILPKSIVLAKGWKKGDIIQYKITDKGDLVLYK